MTTAAVTTTPASILVGDRDLLLDFAGFFRLWTSEEKEDMRESVLADGFEKPIIHDQRGIVIDGINRLLLWQELELNPEDLPLKEVFTSSVDESLQMCLAINAHNQHGRKHTPTDWHALVDKVLARWPDLNSAALMARAGCTRFYADKAIERRKTGQVVQKTLLQPRPDQTTPTSSNGQADTPIIVTPTRRRGDKHTSPADREVQRQAILQELAACGDEEPNLTHIAEKIGCSRNTVRTVKKEFDALPTGDEPVVAPVVHDELNFVVPLELHEVFATREKIEQAAQLAKQLTAIFNELTVLNEPKLQEQVHESQRIFQNLKHIKPYAVCPECTGTGLVRNKCCTTCRLGVGSLNGRGWLHEKAYHQATNRS